MITQTLHIRQVCCKMAQFLVEQLQQEAKDAEKMLVKRAMKEMIPMQLDKEAKLSARRAVAISAMAACHLGQPLTRPINQSLSKALSCKLSTDLARGYVKPPAPPAAVSSMRPSGDGPKRRVSQKQLGALAAQAGAQALVSAKIATLREKERRLYGVPISMAPDAACAAGDKDARAGDMTDSDDEKARPAPLSGMEEREQARRQRVPRGIVRSSKEVHESAEQLVSSSTISNLLKIRKLAAPAIAALASTDASLLSDHGAVEVLLDMLRQNPNLSIQADCLDALCECVRWNQDACVELVEQRGISLLLNLRASASLRVRGQAVQVLSLVLLNPKKFPKFNLDDSCFTDQILRGLCYYVEQPCSTEHAAGVEQVSYEAASLIRRLSQTLSARGLTWECMRSTFSPSPILAPSIGVRGRGRSQEPHTAAASTCDTGGHVGGAALGTQAVSYKSLPSCDTVEENVAEWFTLEDVPEGKLWLSGALGVPAHADASVDAPAVCDGLNYLVEILAGGNGHTAAKMEDKLAETFTLDGPSRAASPSSVASSPQSAARTLNRTGSLQRTGSPGTPGSRQRADQCARQSPSSPSLGQRSTYSLPPGPLQDVQRRLRRTSSFAVSRGGGPEKEKANVVSARTKCQLLLAVSDILSQSHSHSSAHSQTAWAASKASNKGDTAGRPPKSDEPMSDKLGALDFILRKTHLCAVLTSLVRTPLTSSGHAAHPLNQPATASTAASTWQVEMQVLAFETLIHMSQAIRTHSSGVLLADSLLHLSQKLMLKKKAVLPFKWMNSVELLMLAERSCPLYFRAGDVVARQDQWSRSMYLVLSGSLEVSCQTKGRGRAASVARLSVGHLWGENSLFVGESSLFTVTCESAECTLLKVTRESLRSLLLLNPVLHLEVCKHVESLLQAQDQLARKEKQDRMQAQHEEAIQRGDRAAGPASSRPRQATSVLSAGEGKAECLVRVRREKEAEYVGSNEEAKTLMHVCFRTTVHLLLMALPLAKVYLGRAAAATVSPSPASAGEVPVALKHGASVGGASADRLEAPRSRPTSAKQGPHPATLPPRPRSAAARPRSASARVGQKATEGRESQTQSTWSQWTGERVHQDRHPVAPAWSALEFVQQLLRLGRVGAVCRAGMLPPIAVLLASSHGELAARAFACLGTCLQEDATRQYLVDDSSGAQDRTIIDAMMRHVLSECTRPDLRFKAKAKSMISFIDLLSRLAAHAPLRATLLASTEHGEDHGGLSPCAKGKPSTLTFHSILVHLIYCGLALCAGSGKPMLLQSIRADMPGSRVMDVSYREPELLLALLQLLTELSKQTTDASLKDLQMGALQSLSHRLQGKSAVDSDEEEEEEEEDPTDTNEERIARAERLALRLEAKQKDKLSELINCLEIHVSSCVLALGGSWYSPAGRITSHLNTLPGASSYDDSSDADILLRKRVQEMYSHLDLVLQTFHLEDAEKYHKAAKTLNSIRGMKARESQIKAGHRMSLDEAALAIQKRIRGIRGRIRFARLKEDRKKAVLAKMQQKPVGTEEWAATVIQTRFRGMRERKRFKAAREKGVLAKMTKTSVRVTSEEQAALIIQTRFRGMRERKRFKQRQSDPKLMAARHRQQSEVQRILKEQEDKLIQQRVQSMYDHKRSAMRSVAEHDAEGAFAGVLLVTVDRIDGFADKAGRFDITDPFVSLQLGCETVSTTCKDNAGGACVFEEELSLTKSLDERLLKVRVYDKDAASDQLLGEATVNVHALGLAEAAHVQTPSAPIEMLSDGKKAGKVYLAFSRSGQGTGSQQLLEQAADVLEHPQPAMVPIFECKSPDDASMDESCDRPRSGSLHYRLLTLCPAPTDPVGQ
jgi:CRP-like cAMP-binding protein